MHLPEKFDGLLEDEPAQELANKKLYQLVYSYQGNTILPIQVSWNREELEEYAKFLNANNWKGNLETYFVREITYDKQYDTSTGSHEPETFHYCHTHQEA